MYYKITEINLDEYVINGIMLINICIIAVVSVHCIIYFVVIILY